MFDSDLWQLRRNVGKYFNFFIWFRLFMFTLDHDASISFILMRLRRSYHYCYSPALLYHSIQQAIIIFWYWWYQCLVEMLYFPLNNQSKRYLILDIEWTCMSGKYFVWVKLEDDHTCTVTKYPFDSVVTQVFVLRHSASFCTPVSNWLCILCVM